MTFLKYRETRVYPISPANQSFYNIVEIHPKRRQEKSTNMANHKLWEEDNTKLVIGM